MRFKKTLYKFLSSRAHYFYGGGGIKNSDHSASSVQWAH